MNITLHHPIPGGTVSAPPSKSHAHRLLICAALSDKPSRIRCDRTNDDIDATVRCLNALGAKITRKGVWACVITGFCSILLFYPPYHVGWLKAHPALFGVLLSGLAMHGVSALERKKEGKA